MTFGWGQNISLHQELSEALDRYEEVCSEASSAGVDIVSKDFTNNWDYIQSCFFALTILTTIGMNQRIQPIKQLKSKSEIIKTFCRLWKLCSGNIRGPIFLSLFRNYRNPSHVVCPRRCRRNIRGNSPTGLGQKQDEAHSNREETAPSQARVWLAIVNFNALTFNKCKSGKTTERWGHWGRRFNQFGA